MYVKGDGIMKWYEKAKARRKELGLTQEDLAKRLGYSEKSAISKIENGKNDLPLDKFQDLARALDISPTDLIDEPFHNAEQEQKHYYIDEEARQLAEFLYKNEGHRALFQAAQNVKPEDLTLVKELIERFSSKD